MPLAGFGAVWPPGRPVVLQPVSREPRRPGVRAAGRVAAHPEGGPMAKGNNAQGKEKKKPKKDAKKPPVKPASPKK